MRLRNTKSTALSIALLAPVAHGLAQGALQVSVNAVAARVASIEEIVLTAIVSNPTDADVQLIRVANVLDDGPTESFAVFKDGAPVRFTGVSLTPAFVTAPEANFITIRSHDSLAINHTVANVYDFSSHGTGTFTFVPWTTFQSTPGSPPLVVSAAPVSVEVASDVAFRDLIPAESLHVAKAEELVRGAGTGSILSCDDATKLKGIEEGLAASQALAGSAAADIRGRPDSEEWNKFFGPDNDMESIASGYDLIHTNAAPAEGQRVIYCNFDPADICARSTAYEWHGQIYMCDHWFDYRRIGHVCTLPIEEVLGSHESIILHELTHAMLGTIDHVYGCGTVQGIPASQKATNADNYECMALAVYQRSESCANDADGELA